MSVCSVRISRVLIKYSGKYVKIYLNMKITCLIIFMMVLNDLTGPSTGPLAQIPYFIHSLPHPLSTVCMCVSVSSSLSPLSHWFLSVFASNFLHMSVSVFFSLCFLSVNLSLVLII